jgi:hypothetical protein
LATTPSWVVALFAFQFYIRDALAVSKKLILAKKRAI